MKVRTMRCITIGILAIIVSISGSLSAGVGLELNSLSVYAAEVSDEQEAVQSEQADTSAEDKLAEITKMVANKRINRYIEQMDADELQKTMEMFEVMELIKYAHINDVSESTMLSGAIKGEVEALGDPYSAYMDAKTYKNWMLSLGGSFSGVGLTLELKDKVLCVVAPIEGTPGEKAGIISGDQIIKINGQETKNMTVEEAVSKIRGPKDTEVVLTVKRGEKVQDYTLVRTTIQLKTVSGKMLDHHIGYLQIAMFNGETAGQFAQKFNEMEKQGMRGLLLDLRNNPGGLLNASVEIAKFLVPKGPVVSVINKNEKKVTYTSDLPAVKYPLVVLVNGGSASASEILAGAVQDTSAGTLLGTKTFGKGTVQQIFPLADGAAVKLTIAKYYTPKDRFIHGVGIQPDIIIENPKPEKGKKVNDLQKDKALEVLKEKVK
ncbi:MAG: S41 family peptidase [Pelosinus sp.]|nr:S41 family peptidase [Pelosinus sp.]